MVMIRAVPSARFLEDTTIKKGIERMTPPDCTA